MAFSRQSYLLGLPVCSHDNSSTFSRFWNTIQKELDTSLGTLVYPEAKSPVVWKSWKVAFARPNIMFRQCRHGRLWEGRWLWLRICFFVVVVINKSAFLTNASGNNNIPNPYKEGNEYSGTLNIGKKCVHLIRTSYAFRNIIFKARGFLNVGYYE